MDFNDFLAILTYILLLLFIISFTASFIYKSLKLDISFLLVSPNTVSSVKTYRSYSTTDEIVSIGCCTL